VNISTLAKNLGMRRDELIRKMAEIGFKLRTTATTDKISERKAKEIIKKIERERKEAQEKAKMMIDRHCGKTRYDFFRRLEKLVQNYRNEITEVVESAENDVLKALEICVASKNDTVIKISIHESLLYDKIKRLKEIRKSLETIVI